MEVVHEELMDDYHADLMEGFFQKVVYPECHNVMIGNGLGKAGGVNKDNFGSVFWDKRDKRKKKFQARYSLPISVSAKRDRSGKRKPNKVQKQFETIDEAHAWILEKWAEHKDEPNYVGYKNPKTLQFYKTHLANKYDELVF